MGVSYPWAYYIGLIVLAPSWLMPSSNFKYQKLTWSRKLVITWWKFSITVCLVISPACYTSRLTTFAVVIVLTKYTEFQQYLLNHANFLNNSKFEQTLVDRTAVGWPLQNINALCKLCATFYTIQVIRLLLFYYYYSIRLLYCHHRRCRRHHQSGASKSITGLYLECSGRGV